MVTTVTLLRYIKSQLIAEMYNLDADLGRVSALQKQLLVVLAMIEGLVHDQFMTLSFHMFSHLEQWINNAGLLKNCDTFYTEHSYQVDNNVRVNSRNVVKTLSLRLFIMTYCSIRSYYYDLQPDTNKKCESDQSDQSDQSDNTDNTDEIHTFFFTDWNELTANNSFLLKYLTKRNFQDDFLYSRFDIVGHTTITDCFCNNGFSVNGLDYPCDLYYDEKIWESVRWNCKVYSQIHYHGEIFYSHSYKKVVPFNQMMKDMRAIGYQKGFKQGLRVLVMIGFIKLQINGYPYAQAICYLPELVKPFNITSSLITAVRKKDLITLNPKRLCLISCDSIIRTRGSFSRTCNDDYVFFRTNSNYIKQSPLIKNSDLFDSIPVSTVLYCVYYKQ